LSQGSLLCPQTFALIQSTDFDFLHIFLLDWVGCRISMPHAGGEPRPKAGAPRKLAGVGSSAVIGIQSCFQRLLSGSTGLRPHRRGASKLLAPSNGRACSSRTRPRPLPRGAPRCARGAPANTWRSASHWTRAAGLRRAHVGLARPLPHSSADAGTLARSLHPQPGHR
jgi:hypothetical protein